MDIYNCDCFTGMKKLNDKSIDLILTDPPYMISRETNFSKGGGDQRKYGKLTMDFGEWDKGDGVDMQNLFVEFYRLLKPGGTLIMFYDIFKMESIKNIAEKIGFKQPRIGFWNKTNAVPINASVNYLSNPREYFICFCKGKKGIFNSYYDKGVYDYPIVNGKKRIHPTQKPVELMCNLIRVHSNIGDVVFDPFSGSGTTAIAAFAEERKYIGFEIDKTYYDNSIKRIGSILM